MTLYNVTSINSLYDVVNDCQGAVEMVKEDGTRVDIRRNELSVRSMRRNGAIDRLELRVENPDDVAKFILYMMYGQPERVSA